MEDKGKIARKLIELRGERPLVKVAEEMGLTAQALCNYEAGYRVPRDEVKVIISEYYGKTVQEIFFD